MKTTTKYIGDIGEDYAEKYLKKRGWSILSRNFSTKSGEIDIIGYRFGLLVYFEVKTRSDSTFGSPADAVDEKKIWHIKSTARSFLNMYAKGSRIPVFYPFGISAYRPIKGQYIDIIEVYITKNQELISINHIKDRGNQL